MNREQRLTHLDSRGEARMVDVGDKAVTSRLAVARAQIRMKPETLSVILASELSKGDALATARIAAIQAAKKTSDLIHCVTRYPSPRFRWSCALTMHFLVS